MEQISVTEHVNGTKQVSRTEQVNFGRSRLAGWNRLTWDEAG